MIEAKGLTMHYGSVVAVKDASFVVNPGEVVGLLGPNAAGKSTIMKILTTFLYPTRGTAQVAGYDVIQNPIQVRKHTGYLPEVLPLYMDMEVKESLLFTGRAQGLKGKELKERLDWVVQTCGLKSMYRKLVKEISLGYRQRTALAQSIIHDPEVVILDEPTTGLDPHQIVSIRKLIRQLAAQNKTVILSTHILQEVEVVCDRIIIIHRGQIIADGKEEKLKEKACRKEKAYAKKKNISLEQAFLALTKEGSE